MPTDWAVVFYEWHRIIHWWLYCIDLFSCIAASLFNKLTYLLIVYIGVDAPCPGRWGCVRRVIRERQQTQPPPVLRTSGSPARWTALPGVRQALPGVYEDLPSVQEALPGVHQALPGGLPCQVCAKPCQVCMKICQVYKKPCQVYIKPCQVDCLPGVQGALSPARCTSSRARCDGSPARWTADVYHCRPSPSQQQ